MKEILQDKLLVRRLVIVLGYMLISAIMLPYFKKLHGVFLDYSVITSITILAALSGFFQDYVKDYFSSVTVRNMIVANDIIQIVLVVLLYKSFKGYEVDEVVTILTDSEKNRIMLLIVLCAVNASIQSVFTGILGSRTKGYIGKQYKGKYESIDFKEKKLTSIVGIFGLVVFGLFFKYLGTTITLSIGLMLIVASNIYDIMNTKALRELDRIRNEKR